MVNNDHAFVHLSEGGLGFRDFEEQLSIVTQKRLQPTKQQRQQQPKPSPEHQQPNLEYIVTEYDITSRTIAEELAKAADGAIAAKRDKLTPDDVKQVGRRLGVNFEDYAKCKEGAEVFYNGDKKPVVKPSDMLISLVELTQPNGEICLSHQAAAIIGATSAKYRDIEALAIGKWEELNPEETEAKLAALGLPDIKLLTAPEGTYQGGKLVIRERQVLVFPEGRYNDSTKHQILAHLTGEKAAGATEQVEQPHYMQPPATTPPATTANTIDELLPQGRLELIPTQITVRIEYEGQPYSIKNLTLVNRILAMTGQGWKINPKKPGEATFTGQEYVAQSAEALAPIDLIIEFAKTNPDKAKEAAGLLHRYLGQPQQNELPNRPKGRGI
ncbi:MAG: hypothetical protein AABX69_03625 [Nanoarchaeota archaeon]